MVLKKGPVHEGFLKAYRSKPPGASDAGWRKMVFTRRGSLPKAFDSEEALLGYVAKTPGAIGYVSGTGGHPGVKTLAVN